MATTFVTNNFLNSSPALTNTASSLKTMLSLFVTSGALRRFYVQEWSAAASDVPNATDCPIVYDISRMTADGTAVTMTPVVYQTLETGTVSAALSTSKGNYTAEPTVTAQSQLDYNAFNQRASVRWVAVQGGELVAPAVAANGLVWRFRSPNYASTMTVKAIFQE